MGMLTILRRVDPAKKGRVDTANEWYCIRHKIDSSTPHQHTTTANERDKEKKKTI